MPERDTTLCGAGSLWFCTLPVVVHSTNVIELRVVVVVVGVSTLSLCTVLFLEGRFRLLETTGRLGPKECIPCSFQHASVHERLNATPPVGIFPKNVVNKLSKYHSWLLHTVQVRAALVCLEKKSLDG